jgi:hypothetical protein
LFAAATAGSRRKIKGCEREFLQATKVSLAQLLPGRLLLPSFSKKLNQV